MLLILIQFCSVLLLFCSNLVSLSLEKCCHDSLYVETAKVSVPLAGTHKHYWLTGSVCHRDSSTYLQRNAWQNKESKYIAKINNITILISLHDTFFLQVLMFWVLIFCGLAQKMPNFVYYTH